MQNRSRIDTEIIAAWKASHAAHARRQQFAAAALGTVAAVLAIPPLLGFVEPNPYIFSALVFLFLVTIFTFLVINSRRRCPACNLIPNGSLFRIHFGCSGFCIHCNNWLVDPKVS